MYDSIFPLIMKQTFANSFDTPSFSTLLLRLTKNFHTFFIQKKVIHKGIKLPTRVGNTFFTLLLSSSYHPVIHKRTRCVKTLSTPPLKLCITQIKVTVAIKKVI